jgi:hypothetical protein
MAEQPQRMPVRTRMVEMDGDYAGFQATLRVNISMATLDELSNAADLYPVVAGLVQAWNFVDEDGQPIQLGEPGLRALPIELFQMLQRKYSEALTSPLAVTASPASSSPLPPAASRRRRSSRS